MKLKINGGQSLESLGVDPSKLTWYEVSIPKVDMSPSSLGLPYYTWEDYYDDNGWPEYCECCGNRV